MNIRMIRSEDDHHDSSGISLGFWSQTFCVDGKCHVKISCVPKFADDIPDGANALKYMEGHELEWEVGPCDGSCGIGRQPFPDQIMEEVKAFINDGLPRKGKASDDGWI